MTPLQKKAQAFAQLQRDLPTIIGGIVLQFIDDNFQAQGFQAATLKPWRRTATKANTFGTTSAGILIGRGKLRRSWRSRRVGSSVVISAGVPYAQAHNDGFQGPVTVKQHTRRVTEVQKLYSIKTKRARKKRVDVGQVTVKQHTRQMNLPRRRMIGPSPVLTGMIRAEINRRLRAIDRIK